ncbi:hypothetical protein E2C01_099934 [Portunus trituberculatus]|uniref:Uncharacterized protein n=1 Tax=Portunus trituberculatus TaxID=210409 RepID=A0A5B7KBN4_PORTR|nr:hypothetical protein [Portunus trituberculatus]
MAEGSDVTKEAGTGGISEVRDVAGESIRTEE